MEDIVINGQLKLKDNWLVFNDNCSLKLAELSDIEIHYDPKVKVILPAIIFYVSFRLLEYLDKYVNIWWYDIACLVYLIIGIRFIYDRIKHNFTCYSALILTSKSGKNYFIYSNNLTDLKELHKIIREAKVRKNNDFTFEITNRGIINIGDNNKNIMGG